MDAEKKRMLFVAEIKSVLDEWTGLDYDTDEKVRTAIASDILDGMRKLQVLGIADSLGGTLQYDAEGQAIIYTNFYDGSQADRYESEEEPDEIRAAFEDNEDNEDEEEGEVTAKIDDDDG